jgi:peptidyl-prolyl cis-trans isomerase A (cyclophilin A)
MMLPNDEITLVTCGTTKGTIVFEFHKAWSPNGYDNAVKLFKAGYFDNSHFFRTVPGFLVQFGISYNKELEDMSRMTIPDDPQLNPRIPFTTGTVSYAGTSVLQSLFALVVCWRREL